MIYKIIEATFPSAASIISASAQGVPGVVPEQHRPFSTGGIRAFPSPSTRTSVRPIDVLNALSGFCSSAAQSRPARFSK